MARSGPARAPQLFWLFFGLQGRVGRSVYWLAYVVLLAVNSVLIGQIIGGEEASYHALAVNAGPVFILVTLYSNLAVSVKRLHDVGYGGFLALALLVPLVNVAFAIWVGILPGTDGPNPYGDAPDRRPG